jgi:hypothetical protein
MYIRPPASPENAEGFFGALDIYYGDVDIVDYDLQLLTLYDDLIPKIDRQLNNRESGKQLTMVTGRTR